jgi:hypothetical protein
MQLTKPEHIGASQLIRSVVRTLLEQRERAKLEVTVS